MTTTSPPSHTVYRFFDEARVLLYVGKTIAPSKRWSTHERKAPWYADVAIVTRQVFATAEEMSDAERHAIRTESPLYNIQGNPNRHTPLSPAVVMPEGEVEDTLAKRWAVIECLEDVTLPVDDCLGDETVCECAGCHDKRLCSFEDLRSKYEWHPEVNAAIDAVEADYYSSAGFSYNLSDWYYDLFDIQLFAAMRLRSESQTAPLPAFCEIGEGIARVDCPFCFATHHHFMPEGAVINQPLEAGCKCPVSGRYLPFLDWIEMNTALRVWGENGARRAAA